VGHSSRGAGLDIGAAAPLRLLSPTVALHPHPQHMFNAALSLLRVASIFGVGAMSVLPADPLLSVPILTFSSNLSTSEVSRLSLEALLQLQQISGFQRSSFMIANGQPIMQVFAFLEWEGPAELSEHRARTTRVLRAAAHTLGHTLSSVTYLDGEVGGFRAAQGGSVLLRLRWPLAPQSAVARPDALEFLRHDPIELGGMETFIAEDSEIWTSFLASQDGFVAKTVLVPYLMPLSLATAAWSLVHWTSLEQWKSIPVASLIKTEDAFHSTLGYEVPIHALPTDDGFGLP